MLGGAIMAGPGVNPNQASGRVIQATSRITAQNLSLLAQRAGRCGNIHPLTGYVCVTQLHDSDVKHMAMQIGGPDDGKVYSEWD